MSEQEPVPVTAPNFAPASGTAGSEGAGGAAPQLSASTAAAVASRGTPATLNLDDIFGDCFFTPEGDAVFLGDQAGGGAQDGGGVVASAEAVPTRMASRPAPAAAGAGASVPAPAPAAGGGSSSGGTPANYVPVSYGGGIATTGLDNPSQAKSTVMGNAPTPTAGAPKPVPFVQPPQQRHHLQYATPAMLGGARTMPAGGAKRKTSTAPSSVGARNDRKMSDKQKVERRERNREHAKRSRIRKKFLLESLQQSVALLKDENDKLRSSIHEHLGPEADELLKKENLAEAAAGGGGGLIAGSSSDANKVLDDPDFSFIKALQTAQQNFVVTDPSLPDNPIVYATQGFLNLTGYTLDQVLGRNCRFLQGPETDPKAVEKIRNAIEEGSDMSVCLLNYRVDGTTFWNQFFIAALRDAAGNITNYVGVQCKVSDQYAANVCKRQDEADQAMFQEQDDAPADEPPAQAIAPGEDGPAAAAAPAAAPAPPVAS